MKKRFLSAILSLCLIEVFGCSQPTLADSFYLGGIQVNEPDTQEWIEEMQDAEMNTVAVTVYARQAEWDSDQLSFDDDPAGLVEEIRAAKEAGLKVTLILRVSLDHAHDRNMFLWHGLIMPRTDEQLANWFQNYTAFVTQWAAIAEAEGVDVLGIGSELNSLTSTQPVDSLPDLERYYLDDTEQQARMQRLLDNREQVPSDYLWTWGDRRFDNLESYLQTELQAWQSWASQVSWQDTPDPIANINERRLRLERQWRRLIRDVRSIYSGDLTYAANFDQYHQVGFWDALDYMGINAYFSLRSGQYVPKSDESLETALEAGWFEVLSEIDALRQEEIIDDKPVIFTELGYTRWQNSTVHPWAYSGFSLVESEADESEADLNDVGRDDAVLVWQEQPLNLQERVLAIEALYDTVQTHYPDLLDGILYWKFSTQPDHVDIEPFVLILNDSDPLQDALTQFVE